jgi:hypothetical protein
MLKINLENDTQKLKTEMCCVVLNWNVPVFEELNETLTLYTEKQDPLHLKQVLESSWTLNIETWIDLVTIFQLRLARDGLLLPNNTSLSLACSPVEAQALRRGFQALCLNLQEHLQDYSKKMRQDREERLMTDQGRIRIGNLPETAISAFRFGAETQRSIIQTQKILRTGQFESEIQLLELNARTTDIKKLEQILAHSVMNPLHLKKQNYRI